MAAAECGAKATWQSRGVQGLQDDEQVSQGKNLQKGRSHTQTQHTHADTQTLRPKKIEGQCQWSAEKFGTFGRGDVAL